MSVLKNLQDLSDLEFYKCAEKLQDDITDFCLRDFGLKKSPRSVKQVIKNIDEKDQEEINAIFAKYGRTPNQQFKSVRSTDALYKSLFGGYYDKEENGINGRRARRDRIANPHAPIKARRAN